jgi:hypothetical protein
MNGDLHGLNMLRVQMQIPAVAHRNLLNIRHAGRIFGATQTIASAVSEFRTCAAVFGSRFNSV